MKQRKIYNTAVSQILQFILRINILKPKFADFKEFIYRKVVKLAFARLREHIFRTDCKEPKAQYMNLFVTVGGMLTVLFLTLLPIGFPNSVVQAQIGYPPPQIPNETNYIVTTNKLYLPLIVTGSHINNSYYVASLNNMHDLGRIRGLEHAYLSNPISDIVILDFGSPQIYVDGNNNYAYGTLLFDYNTYIYNSQLKSAVQEYVLGYLEGSILNPSSHLTVIVGTNSSGYHVTYEHGNAWGDLIYGSDIETGLRNWLTGVGGIDQVNILGGIDVEPGNFPSWRVPSAVDLWMKGYAEDYPTGNRIHTIYAYSATGGDCPTDLPPTQPQYQSGVLPANCSTVTKPTYDAPYGTTEYTWTQEDIYHLSWDIPDVGYYPNIFPIPQIYTEPETAHPNGRNAEQWYRIGLYSYLKHNIGMFFQGVITQQSACDYNRQFNNGELPPECVGAYLSKNEAFQLFTDQLNSDPYGRTYSGLLQWKTDFGFYIGVP